jgi:hypothetical protein
MNTWIIRITDPATQKLISNNNDFEHSGLNRFIDRIKVEDLVFIYLGGDTGKIDWQPGFWGFGKVIREPFNIEDKNFSILVRPVKVLSEAIPIIEGKLHPLYCRTLFADAPYVGANHFPTQAISEVTGEGTSALWLILEEKDEGFSQFIPSAVREYESLMKKQYLHSTSESCRTIIAHQDVSNGKWNLNQIPKPFLLLAGISGTGKTKWVRDQEEPAAGNLEIIPVRPDWHEPSDLLGYISRISGNPEFVPTSFLHFLVSAWRNAWAAENSLNSSAVNVASMTPFWLCLDEMNLAPVEQYFADYLSVLELRKWSNGIYSCPPLLRIGAGLAEPIRLALGMAASDPLWMAFAAAGGIPLPPNLIVVGTVNMDETTHSFSRKVLDRALTVEFDAVDFTRYGGTHVEGHAGIALPWGGISAVTDADDLELDPERKQKVIALLEAWNEILAQTAFRIAYRTINEALLIAGSLPAVSIGQVLDWIAMTKLLPRLEGDEDKLGLDRDGAESSYLDKLLQDWATRFGDGWEESRSKKKLDFMAARLQRSGYTSFWP